MQVPGNAMQLLMLVLPCDVQNLCVPREQTLQHLF